MPELWRNCEGSSRYFVSNQGQVKGPRGHVLKQATMRRGYKAVTVDGRLRKVHQLVAEAFIGSKPSGMYCCHRDDDPSNNNVENLYWGTPSQNEFDKIRNGKAKHHHGSANPAAKLTEHDVKEIRSLAGTNKAIAEQYGVSAACISLIKRRKVWAHCA